MSDLSKRRFIKTGISAVGALLFGMNKASGIFYLPKPWKWSMKAMYYAKTPRGLKCLICPNECILKNGEVGLCNNRVNEGGVLYTTAYGNPCAIHSDPIEKKPMYHFLPGTRSFSIATAGCNLACLNCQNWEISQKSPKETRNYELWPDDVVSSAQKYNCQSIAYTYTEPITYYEYTLDTAKKAREMGIKNVMVSAGYINQEPLRELAKFIDGANIDLKSFSDDIYMELNAGSLEPILNTLKVLKEEGVWLEITNLVIPGWTDKLDMIKEMCNWLKENGFEDTPLHFSRFHPMYKLSHIAATPVQTLESAYKIAKAAGLNYVYIGNVPGTEHEHTYCPKCKKIVIERQGFNIASNFITEGKCQFCNHPIAGVWE